MKYPSLILLIHVLLIISCHKSENLDRKPSSAILIPSTPADFQKLLDNETLFCTGTYLGLLSGDEFYFSDQFSTGLSASEFRAYTWQNKIFDNDENVADWNNSYAQIFCANTVIEGLDKIMSTNKENSIMAIKGDALFKRAIAFYNLAQIFSLAYDSTTFENDLGIPLRVSTDKNESLTRASVKATYEQIISDLKLAIPLLGPTIPIQHRNRSSQPAAWAMLARVYLSMRSYQQASDAAQQCLNLYDSLINYNQLDASIQIPFDRNNKETLYQQKSPAKSLIEAAFRSHLFIDSTVLDSYTSGDLRPAIFFGKTFPIIKYSYYGEIYPFSGIGTAEVFLIMAECQARLNKKDQALQFLNRLLQKRFINGQFIPYTAANAEETKLLILAERKKELVLRGLRWTDIRRLNKEDARIDLTRIVNNIRFYLPANDPRYALPIPENIMKYNRYIQNPR